jgi:DNA-binding NarL/FixJ family response regulator
MPKKKSINILITDDHPLFRRILRSVLRPITDLNIVGEAENGQVAVLKTKELAPDVVLMDVDMPVLDGISATRHIKAGGGNTVIIALSNQSDEYFVKAMLNAGATDYVLKSANPREIERSIRQAYSKRPSKT